MAGGVISDIRRPAASTRAGAGRVLDLGGRYLCPGLIDIHTHGALGVDYSHLGDDIATATEFLARHGVTAFLPTPGQPPYEDIVANVAALRAAAEDPPPGARIVGINFEGPYLNPKHGSRRENVLLPTPEQYRAMIEAAGPLARIMTVAPELEGARELIRYLNERGIIPSIGHSEAALEDLEFAVHCGARLATHMFCAMGQPEHERKGIKPVGIEEHLLDMDEITAEVIADERGIHVAPHFLKALVEAKGRNRVILITDSIRMTGMSEDEYEGADGRTFVHDGDLRIVKSTGDVSGSLMTLDRAVANMMRHTGVSLRDAVYMASLTPARLLRIDDRKGSIAVGMDADLIAVDEEMQVFLTLVAGEVAWDGLGSSVVADADGERSAAHG